MYGTTMKSFSLNQTSKNKKLKKEDISFEEKPRKRLAKKESQRVQDKKYINLNNSIEKETDDEIENSFSEGFSIKDLPIASVVITIILTMMMLVMTSGFGGI